MSRQAIVDLAAAQNGVKETPSNSNKTKYGQWYGLDGVKWCCIYVSWVYHHAGHPLEAIDKPKGYQSCQSGFNFWKRKNCIVKSPQAGDIVLYDWTGNGTCDHTGIFVKWLNPEKTVFEAWEGNTAQGNDSDGGQVMLRERRRSLVKAFVTPLTLGGGQAAETNVNLEKGDAGSDVTVLQKLLHDLGYTITVDGVFGPGTHKVVEQFQREYALDVTGVVTPEVLGVIQEEASLPKVPERKFTSGAYIKKGDSGSVVVSIQHALNNLGAQPKLTEDGVFGAGTVAAVKAFQASKNLSADGIVGPATFAALGLTDV